MAFAPNVQLVPTRNIAGATVSVPFQAIINTRIFVPDAASIETANGLRQAVTMVNAIIYARRWVPQPFANALLTLFEGSIVTLPDGYVGLEYDLDWVFLSDPTVSLYSGSLPPGLVFTPVSLFEWTITGVPTLAGYYTFQLQTTTVATTGYITFHVTILPRPPVWGDFELSPGYLSMDYLDEWFLENVTFPCIYSLVSGTPPPGLILQNFGESGGRISGIPTELGEYNFTLRATNSDGTADKPFSIIINPGGGGSTTFILGN